MATTNCLLFEESCLNLALNKPAHFISAYPTKVVFGKCLPLGYESRKYFYFELNELFNLYFAIFELVQFFASNTIFEKKLILSKSPQHYFLMAKVLWINNELQNVGLFGIEQEDDHNSVTFELFFTDIELNDFIYAIIKIIPSTLCLTSLDLELFFAASNESVKAIKLLKSEKHAKILVKKLSKDINQKISEVSIYNQATLLGYYCEIILLLNKLKTLFNQNLKFDNIEAIILKS